MSHDRPHAGGRSNPASNASSRSAKRSALLKRRRRAPPHRSRDRAAHLGWIFSVAFAFAKRTRCSTYCGNRSARERSCPARSSGRSRVMVDMGRAPATPYGVDAMVARRQGASLVPATQTEERTEEEWLGEV